VKPTISILAAMTLLGAGAAQSASSEPYDVVIRGGSIYDGSGGRPFIGDVGVKGDRIVFVGRRLRAHGRREIDARGLAVAPGFINMLSGSDAAFIADGRSESDIRQGVTMEVFGEGWSMGPLTPEMKQRIVEQQARIKYPITWTTLGEFLAFLQAKGVAANFGSFVGAATVRIHELGEENVDPTPGQLDRMRAVVREAMDEGALGVASALIYAPGSFAKPDELVALSTEAGRCGGVYASHIRSEGDRLLEAIDELVETARRSGTRTEIYHLKVAGRGNWAKYDAAIARIEAAQAAGLPITADMYLYTAGGTGLNAAMPLWVQEGGVEQWLERLKDPAIRTRVAAEMRAPGKDWENLLVQAGPDGMVLASFRSQAMRPYQGMTLAALAGKWGESPEDAAIDAVLRDGSRVGTIYQLMNEDLVRREMALPWVSFGSDAPSQTTAPATGAKGHPRGFGNFARLLGRYVREQRVMSLQEAVRRLTSLPAGNLGLSGRGTLKQGDFADVAVFDPRAIRDTATFDDPQRYAVGMRDVLVNGVLVLKDGEHTGALPGRAVMGPGWKRCH
jgi:N-acyl-D-amino-acid deacylase